MAVLDIDKYLGGRTKNRIEFVGVELEGGWHKPIEGAKYVGDGSVFEDGHTTINMRSLVLQYPQFKRGELPSPKIEPIGIPKWIQVHHPNVVDKTCGMHIHMSFKHTAYYEALTESEFFDTLPTYLERWGNKVNLPSEHVFWSRLRGENRFCQKTHNPFHQLLSTTKDFNRSSQGSRYTFLNYCWGYRGTVECRVLPMFDDPALSIDAVMTVLDITNASIVALSKRRPKISEEVILPPDSETEETDEIELF